MQPDPALFDPSLALDPSLVLNSAANSCVIGRNLRVSVPGSLAFGDADNHVVVTQSGVDVAGDFHAAMRAAIDGLSEAFQAS